jgi:hypothetical protein
MDLLKYFYGARKESGPTPQLAKDFVFAFRLLLIVLCQAREVTGDSQIYLLRPVLRAVGVGDVTMMADIFKRFRERPSFMVEHPAFDFFWPFLLPGGTPLIDEARGAIGLFACQLAVHAYIEERQANEVVALTLGAPTFDALMNGDLMPGDPMPEIHGSARRTWRVLTIHPEVEELRGLRTLAASKGELRAELNDIVRRFCRIFANAGARREGCSIDKFHDIYAVDALVGRHDAQTPEQHARTWGLGGANGHLDALLLGRENEAGFVAWLTEAVDATNDNGVPLPLTVTVASSQDEGGPLPVCVPPAADLGQYDV